MHSISSDQFIDSQDFEVGSSIDIVNGKWILATSMTSRLKLVHRNLVKRKQLTSDHKKDVEMNGNFNV